MALIQDYNNFTYSLPAAPEEKDWKQLASKLKTYIGSTKFIHEGSPSQWFDPAAGKMEKTPLTGVVYKKDLKSNQGLTPGQFHAEVNRALIENDRPALQELSKYHWFQAERDDVTAEEKKRQEEKQRTRRLARNALLLGGAGSLLGMAPVIQDWRKGLTGETAKEALGMGTLGISLGLLIAGVIS